MDMTSVLNKEIVIRVDGVNLQGKLVRFSDTELVLEGNAKFSYITRSKISMFVLAELISQSEKVEPKEQAPKQETEVPLTMLACQNKGIKCVGVRCVINKFKQEIDAKDYDAFMSPCSKRRPDCKNGIIGNVYDIDSKILVYTLKDVIFGEYPV